MIDNISELVKNKYYDKYNFIIYIDTSINDRGNPINSKLINFCSANKTRVELIEITMTKLLNPDGRGHIGLLGTIFRYLPLFDKDVEECFIADSDNYNSIFLYELLEKFFKESRSNLMTFRPILYYRKNDENKCFPNFFAGMMAFKKNKNEIY